MPDATKDTLLYRLSSPAHIPDDALTRLARRLEAATSRLEDIASSTFDNVAAGLQAPPPAQPASAAPAAPKAPSAPAAPGAPAAPAKSDVPPMLAAFDALLDNELKDFVDKSKGIDDQIAEQAKALSDAFTAQRQFLQVSTLAKKPDVASPVFLEVLKDLQSGIEKVDQVKQISKDPKLKNHLTMVGDGVGVLGWVTMDSKPGDVAAELFGGAQMYGNKVLKEAKENNTPEHAEWVQSFYKLFKALISYIKESHPQGVQWNPSGIDAAEALRQVKSGGANSVSAAPPAGGAPPPPPPPPLPTFDNAAPPPPPGPAPVAKKAAPDMGAVFDELNKGEAVTAGLRKVDASQMTHKNPSLRANSTVPERKDSTGSRGKSPAPPGKKPKPESMRTKKPPKMELDGNKWIIENFEDHPEPLEIEATIVQSILITRCKHTTIRVKGKGNAISIDNSSRTSIVLDSLVSSVDVIRCPNFALQVMGTLPTLLLDQVDGASIYLGPESLGTEIFSSKCTSVNINLPPSEEDGDYTEHPIPEQFKTFIKDGKLISEIVEHAG
ncbi:adenylate cyclase associated N terminal-domain-containing protein [Macrophomina phaseolina]|uniref:Adenylyl cyclase-associated protein n=1 Tax=Macrophomina phaseolina TaxID=35725 RepID=A0ABQ8G158_9PEZI|nr:adenylate cyclase associated N terminal-domain-containing protein [Macrophomina phaseolina]